MKAVGFLGFGSYLPPQVRDNSFWPHDFDPDEESQRKRTIIAVERTASGEKSRVPPEIAAAMTALGDDPYRGAKLRHVLSDEAEPSDLEAEAGKRAIRAAQITPGEIDLALVYTMVHDRLTPTNGPAVQAKCELTNASSWSMDLACATFQPQLIAAHALIQTETYQHVLCVASSAASRILDYDAPTSLVFGDGAAAAVLGEVPEGYGILGHYVRTDGSLREGIVFAPLVDGQPQKRWDRCTGPIRLSSFDVEMGKQAGLRATEFCQESCDGALKMAGLEREDVDFFVCAQSTGWFVDACRRSLGLGADKTIDTFGEVGNLGAANIPFNLERAWREGRIEDGDLVLLYSPGAGLTRGAVAYRWIAPRSGVV